MKSLVLIIVCCVFFLVPLSNCQKEENDFSGAEVIFPIEENIPHFNSDHILLQRDREIIDKLDIPLKLALLKQYLEAPENLSLEKLPILVGEAPINSGFDIVSAGNGRQWMIFSGTGFYRRQRSLIYTAWA